MIEGSGQDGRDIRLAIALIGEIETTLTHTSRTMEIDPISATQYRNVGGCSQSADVDSVSCSSDSSGGGAVSATSFILSARR